MKLLGYIFITVQVICIPSILILKGIEITMYYICRDVHSYIQDNFMVPGMINMGIIK